MSRVAKVPVKIPAGVQVTQGTGELIVKGQKGTMTLPLPKTIQVEIGNGEVAVTEASMKADKMNAGTIRALLNNLVIGVSTGYERRLQLVGVGYRAAMSGRHLTMSVGLSHTVEFDAPEGITIECPTQTEIVIKGASKHMVGQVAASLRSHRPPEPYKGKGVRYSDERVELKEAKKK